MTPPDWLIAGLRDWTRRHDPHVRAAVELVIDHGHWLGDEQFVARYVHRDDPDTFIAFRRLAADLADSSNPLLAASSSQVAVLRLAADLATDRWRISRMDDDTVHLVRTAIAAATE